MRALILLLLTFLSISAYAKNCKEYERVAEYLDTEKFVEASRHHRKTPTGEIHLDLDDVNQARSLTYKFPAFEDLGFGKPGGRGWKSYTSRHPHSALQGKKIGWEIKNEHGHARIRMDWDPVKGGHYNIEITEKNPMRHETHKLAISFLCGGQKCTEQQVLKMVNKMQ
jgi:hypothetical protein